MDKIKVGILGATGMVGQRFVQLLADHPWFEVTAVAASERSAGKRYAEAANWVVPGEIPSGVADLTVTHSEDIDALGSDVKLVFSALPSSAARELEPELAARGYIVCTNASALRMDPDVPLLIPEINADHVGLIDAQRERLRLDAGAKELMLRCALRHGRAVGYWLGRAEGDEQALSLAEEALLSPQGEAARQGRGVPALGAQARPARSGLLRPRWASSLPA